MAVEVDVLYAILYIHKGDSKVTVSLFALASYGEVEYDAQDNTRCSILDTRTGYSSMHDTTHQNIDNNNNTFQSHSFTHHTTNTTRPGISTQRHCALPNYLARAAVCPITESFAPFSMEPVL